MTEGAVRVRLRSLFGIALAALALLSLQVLRMQVIDPVDPPALASGDQPRVIESEAARGLIYDRNGMPLVQNVASYLVRLVPADLPEEPDERRRALVAIERATSVPVSRLEAATRDGIAAVDPTAPVAVHEVADATEAIRLRTALSGVPGVEVVGAPTRVYAGGDLLAHLLGSVAAIDETELVAYLDEGYPMDATVGRSGLEAVYEEELRGSPERRLVVADPTGRVLSELGGVAAEPGSDLQLSIDIELQAVVAETLAEGIVAGLPAAYPGRPAPRVAGAAVVLDVRSGEVLAQVSLPSFDANALTAGDDAALAALLEDPARPLVDRTYMESHPPGSTFKTLVAYAALEEGVATPDTRITSLGAIYVQDEYNPEVTYVFRDWAAHGTTDLYRGLAVSSDVYFYYLSGGYRQGGQTVFEGLGAERLADYARQIGLGTPTGLDLPGETSGLVPDPDWKEEAVGDPWFLGDTYTFGIGQGYLTVTPMQMAVLVAAIANDGEVLRPRLVRAIGRDGEFVETPRVVVDELANERDSLAVVREAMRITASATGTAWRGQPAGLTIGGKTGTAEFGAPYPNGNYDSHGWYIGFAPFDDPEIAVAVYVEHGIGSTHAGPVARRIFEHYFGLTDEVR
jgi:penicillin-binding protein 2